MKVILASQSPSRKKLLSKAGLIFEVFAPHIQEEKFINPADPKNSCLTLAKKKALKAQNKFKKDIIIACDQMAHCEGKLFGKAGTTKKAIENLIQLNGKTHQLVTGLCMLWEHQIYSYSCESQIKMRTLSLKQIKNYVLNEQPLQSAGSYHIEAQGICLFEKIKTEDFNAIEGLPLIRVITQLIKWNYPLFVN